MRWNFSLSALFDDAFGKLEDIILRIRADYMNLPSLVVGAAIIFGIITFFPEFETTQPPGILVPTAPLQTAVPSTAPIIMRGDNQITPLAAYDITGRVIAKQTYRWGREADIAPVDLTLGWQAMSDTSVLSHFRFHISRRYASWRYRESPLSDEDINNHSSNNHLIPATPRIEKALKHAHVGDVVHLRGYLVRVHASDGYEWSSSLTRTDTGWGACELMYVESVE